MNSDWQPSQVHFNLGRSCSLRSWSYFCDRFWKALEQNSQLYGLELLWLRLCLDRLELFPNRSSQISHLKGFSPVWTIRCLAKWESNINSFLQMWHWKFNCPCSSSICFRKYLNVSKLSLHILQMNILRFSGFSEKSFITDSILRSFLENFRENIKSDHHEAIQPKYNLIISLDTFLKILSQCWVKRISSCNPIYRWLSDRQNYFCEVSHIWYMYIHERTYSKLSSANVATPSKISEELFFDLVKIIF